MILEFSPQVMSYFLMRSHAISIHNPSSLSLKSVLTQFLASSGTVEIIANESMAKNVREQQRVLLSMEVLSYNSGLSRPITGSDLQR